jgi:DNA mismatch repair protein MSH4
MLLDRLSRKRQKMCISTFPISTVRRTSSPAYRLKVLTNPTEQYEIQAETRYDNSRRYWLRIAESSLDGRAIPDILINQYRKKGFLECQTLDLVKLNQRIEDSHQEVVLMSDKTVQTLIDDIRGEIPRLFRVCESIAMLDMIAAFRYVCGNQKLILQT